MRLNRQPLRLAFCNATRSWGGVKTWTLEFARALSGRGHQLHILGRDERFLSRARQMGLPARHMRFGPDFNPFAIRRFMRFFREHAIDAVMVNVSQDLRSAGVAARLGGRVLVQRIGMPDDMRPTAKVRLLDALLKPEYLCPCQFIASGLAERFPGAASRRIQVIHSAKIPVAEPPGAVHSPVRLITTSQLNADKGHAQLIPVLAALKRRGFSFTWDVVGTGDREEEVKALCAASGLSDRVRFHGFTQDVGALLDQSDVFVLPSRTEGLPNTLLEALAHGLVPVSCAVGGVAEAWPSVLRPLLVPPWDDATQNADPGLAPMGRALALVLEQGPETLLEWKRAAWQHCREHFSLTVQAEKLEAWFYALTRPDQETQP